MSTVGSYYSIETRYRPNNNSMKKYFSQGMHFRERPQKKHLRVVMLVVKDFFVNKSHAFK